jgi:serine/threonine protein kinase
MSDDRQVTELLLRWEALRQQGNPVTVDELCCDCPEHRDEVRRRVEVLERAYQVLDNDGPTRSGIDAYPDANRTPTARPGEQAKLRALAGYKLLEELGHGGMGVVYKARDSGLKRVVAVKMIRAAGLARPEELARFRAEAEAVARLQHPHIVQIFATGEQDGQPYFALEYVAGGSLEQKLQGRPQPSQDAARLVMLLARAVHAAHQQGIVHRDLKPANVLLAAPADEPALNSAYGCPKVTDFGLVKYLDGAQVQTASGALLGTPNYMAPEQAAGLSQAVGPATDVHALGVILYEMLTGRPPYRGLGLMATLDLVRSQPPLPLRALQPNTPPELEAICQRCLAKAPQQRYATAAALADDLHRFLGGQPVAAPPPPVPQPSGRRWSRRHLALAGAVLLACLVPLVWWLLHEPGPERTAEPGPGTQPLSGELIVRVWTKGTKEKQGLRVEDFGALPVRPGEQIHVVARLNQPAYIYLLWIDGKGEVTPLYPWHDNNEELVHDLKVPPPRRPPAAEVDSPKKISGGYGLDDAAGLETVLLLARRTPLPADQSLARLLGKVPAGELNDPREVALLSHDSGRRGGHIDYSHNRGIKKKPEEIDAPMLQLMARLAGEFEVIRAVRFAHVGK